jgi:flagellar FliL protein
LSGGGGDRFLQIAFTLQVAESRVADELKLQMPVVRSRLLLLLASKTAEELGTTAGKHKLIGDLLAESRAPLANELPGKGVENVLFSALVIQ